MKVQCADCDFYKFTEGIDSEPLGGCENEEVLTYAEKWQYNGYNWRLNHKNSKSVRYCKGFKLRETVLEGAESSRCKETAT